jgi:hypothetical protein
MGVPSVIEIFLVVVNFPNSRFKSIEAVMMIGF